MDWIKAEDELPKNNSWSAVWYNDDYEIAYYDTKHGWDMDFGWPQHPITHWAPLQKPPEEGE